MRDTLCCGQCFRFFETGEGAFTGVALGRRLTLSQSGDRLTVSGCSPEEWAKDFVGYFALDTDYAALKRQLADDPILAEAVTYAPGIRVMRQPFWETLCSFIISQNNNIGRIMGIVDRLCEGFGDDLGGFHDFPSAGRLAALEPEELAPIRCGFRARYIIDAARRVSSGQISPERLRSAPLESARAELMTITGVGPKVADCALLFGAGRLEAFPLDVWMKRAMAELFPEGLPECARPIAGIAQQYIFHYARRNRIGV